MTTTAFRLLLGLALATGAGHAHASRNADVQLDVQATPFQQQAALIRTDLSGGDKYAEISPADRETVLQLLERIESELASAGGVEALPAQAKVDVFNSQERVNTILTGARADSRVVCTRGQITGSHRRQQNCQTIAERERRRARDQENMQHTQRLTRCQAVGANCEGPGI